MLAVTSSVQSNGSSPAGDKGSPSLRGTGNELAHRAAAPQGARASRGKPGKKLLAPSDLDVFEEQVLGRGGAGNVYKGTLGGPKGPRAVAVKVLEGDPKPGEPPLEYILLEKALKGCKFVCEPLGYCEKDGKMCMVLHLYEKSLTKYIRERAGELPCSCLKVRIETVVVHLSSEIVPIEHEHTMPRAAGHCPRRHLIYISLPLPQAHP